jgi:predicted ATPase
MLNRFHVENYKCLRDVTVPLTPIHVLIGQNDAGKSSLLEALYAFFRSSHYALPEAYSGHWLGDDLVYEGAADPKIALEGTWSDFGTYGLRTAFGTRAGLGMTAKRHCLIAEEWVTQKDAQRTVFQTANHDHTAIKRRRHQAGRGDTDKEIETQVGIFLDGAHLYRLDPRLMAIPSELSPKRRFRLDPDGFGLPGLLDDILGYDIDHFAKIRNEFCRFFPQFRGVRVETEQGISREFHETGRHSAREVIGKGIHFETQGGRNIRAQQASDGAILFLGFLALANLPHPPRLLLVEEPETGIYPERLGQVIELLRKLTEEAGEKTPQIVFSTHSPYMLSFFQPEEVTFMSRGDDGAVRARPLRDAPHIQERLDGFYLGELWYNLSEEELFADA